MATYLVTFQNYDGSIISTQNVEEGQLAQKPVDPIRDGYKFMGWNPSISTIITKSTIFTAQYSIYLNTDFYAVYELTDTTAKDEAVYTGDTNSTIALSPIFTSVACDSTGKFTNTPELTATFTSNHSSVGLMLNFIEPYPQTIEITWYGSDGAALYIKTVNINNKNMFVSQSVYNYKKITIDFIKGAPSNKVQLDSIDYGYVSTLDSEYISEGTLVEEQNLISDQLPINKLDFSFVDLNESFNLGNRNGIQQYIQKGQVIKPYEHLNGKTTYLGKFFIENYSEDQGLVKMSCYNYIGLLDNIEFYKGDIYTGTKAGVIIDSIMSFAGITDYTIDSGTYNIELFGTIGCVSCRQALREVLFACEAIVNTSRSDTISIKQKSVGLEDTIGRNIKISTKAINREYVNGVTVKYTKYTSGTSTEEIVSGNYSTGDTLIKFDKPFKNITTDVGTIKESGKYYCILTLTGDSTVTITGIPYNSLELFRTYKVELESGQAENIKTFSSTLCDFNRAYQIAQDIFQYYNYKLEIDIQYLAENQTLEKWYKIENSNSDYDDYIGVAESISTDLVGGFVATSVMTGFSKISNLYYMGTEIYMNDRIII